MESVGNALHNIEISIHNLEEAVDKVGTASGRNRRYYKTDRGYCGGNQPALLKCID